MSYDINEIQKERAINDIINMLTDPEYMSEVTNNGNWKIGENMIKTIDDFQWSRSKLGYDFWIDINNILEKDDETSYSIQT
jgi:hypothetical protein